MSSLALLEIELPFQSFVLFRIQKQIFISLRNVLIRSCGKYIFRACLFIYFIRLSYSFLECILYIPISDLIFFTSISGIEM